MESLNAKIINAELSMADHGCLTMWLMLEGSGWGCGFGGYRLGKGYLGAKEFDGSAKGMESIMRIMDVVGVENFTDLKNKYVRAELEGFGGGITRIGHITEDKWFSYKEFFKEET